MLVIDCIDHEEATVALRQEERVGVVGDENDTMWCRQFFQVLVLALELTRFLGDDRLQPATVGSPTRPLCRLLAALQHQTLSTLPYNDEEREALEAMVKVLRDLPGNIALREERTYDPDLV